MEVKEEEIYTIQVFTCCTWQQGTSSWHDMYRYSNLKTKNEANKWIKKLRRGSELENDGKEYRILKRNIKTITEIKETVL